MFSGKSQVCKPVFRCTIRAYSLFLEAVDKLFKSDILALDMKNTKNYSTKFGNGFDGIGNIALAVNGDFSVKHPTSINTLRSIRDFNAHHLPRLACVIRREANIY